MKDSGGSFFDGKCFLRNFESNKPETQKLLNYAAFDSLLNLRILISLALRLDLFEDAPTFYRNTQQHIRNVFKKDPRNFKFMLINKLLKI